MSIRSMTYLDRPRRFNWLLRLMVFVGALYVFLTAIKLFSMAMQGLSEGAVDRLVEGLSNPFAALAVGVLATVLVQSSSVTTSMIVAWVGSGQLAPEFAVPMVMGANIGTSITNTLVSLGHVTQNSAFRRAFAGATVHDLFNLLTVAILLPLELATGFLLKSATWIVGGLNIQGAKFDSPIKGAIGWAAKGIHSLFADMLGLTGTWLAAALFTMALVLIVGSLIVITKNMRALMADRIEQWLNRVLKRSGLLGLSIGAAITTIVQSSSITTSLLIPMFGAGVLTLEAGFPIMLGANIGTTITALLAVAATKEAGLALTIAVVHLLFNICGTLIFFPLKPMRRIPISLAEGLAALAVRNRLWVVVYLLVTFGVLPLAGILIWK